MKKIISIIVIGTFLFNSILLDLGWAGESKLLRGVPATESKEKLKLVHTYLAIPEPAPEFVTAAHAQAAPIGNSLGTGLSQVKHPILEPVPIEAVALTNTMEPPRSSPAIERLQAILLLARQNKDISGDDFDFVESLCRQYGFKAPKALKKLNTKTMIDMLLTLVAFDEMPTEECISPELSHSVMAIMGNEAVGHEYGHFAQSLNISLEIVRKYFANSEPANLLYQEMLEIRDRFNVASRILRNFDLIDRTKLLILTVDSMAISAEKAISKLSEALHFLEENKKIEAGKYGENIYQDLPIWIESLQVLLKLLINIHNSFKRPNLEVECDLNELLRTVNLGILKQHASLTGFRVVLDLDNKIPPLCAYPDISLIWTNLCFNARDAVVEKYENCDLEDKHGVITITSKYDEDDNETIVTIADNGVGIREGNIPEIWKDNFTTKVKGTGKGLGFVRAIVRRHGGQIAVASELDKGTTFTIRLPARTSAVIVGEKNFSPLQLKDVWQRCEEYRDSLKDLDDA